MKKIIVSIAFLMGTLTISYGGEGDKVKVLSKDTTSNELVFDVESKNVNQVSINLSGVHDDLASISLVNQRGGAIYYEFIQDDKTDYCFDLSNVKPGKYYVKLNANNEIRMKMIVVE
jgi:hypothetical protein